MSHLHHTCGEPTEELLRLAQAGDFYRFEELIESQFVKEDAGNSVESVEGVDDDHEDEPEPHGEIHLLIDDVLKESIH